MTAKLIHREINADGDSVTHVYSNGDVWQISKDETRGTFAARITNGYTMRWFPSPEFIELFGEPDDWRKAPTTEESAVKAAFARAVQLAQAECSCDGYENCASCLRADEAWDSYYAALDAAGMQDEDFRAQMAG